MFASHIAINFLKAFGIRVITFNESSLINYYANYYDFQNWVKKALKIHAKKDDKFLISSNGELLNTINAFQFAKVNKLKLITFSAINKNIFCQS